MARPGERGPRHRTKVANGTRPFLNGVDGRSEEGRHHVATAERLAAERGGWDALDTVKVNAIRQYSTLVVLCERLTGKMAAGEDVDPEAFGQLCDRMNRLTLKMGAAKPAAKRNLDDWISDKRKGRA